MLKIRAESSELAKNMLPKATTERTIDSHKENMQFDRIDFWHAVATLSCEKHVGGPAYCSRCCGKQ